MKQNNYGIKTYEQIMEEINSKILADPKLLQREIEWLDSEISKLDEEIRFMQLDKKYGHTIRKTLELDFFTNTMKYQEVAPDGEILIEKCRGFKPRDDLRL